MVEQVIFKIDKKLKDQAMKKAKRDGLSFSAVLKRATQSYVEDQFEIGLVYNPKLIRAVRRAEREPTIRGNLRKLLKAQ